MVIKYRKSIGGYILDSVFGVNDKTNIQEQTKLSECGYCGKLENYSKCQKLFCDKILCKDCAKKCKKCGRFFCPKHINSHGCGTLKKEIDDDLDFDVSQIDVVGAFGKVVSKKLIPKKEINKRQKQYKKYNETSWECDKCNREFFLTKEEESELKKEGKVKILCPYCKMVQFCKN